jgi:hypothetical protein
LNKRLQDGTARIWKLQNVTLYLCLQAAAVTSDANGAVADMIAHAEVQMNLPASDVDTRRPPEQVRGPSSLVYFPPRVIDPFKLRFVTRHEVLVVAS